MGKKYYCDYCNKTMVATPSIVRTHNKGLNHQKLLQEHYQNFKDPSIILSEESKKKPCTKYAQGNCNFGVICRFSHYTREQLQTLQNYVTQKNNENLNAPQASFQELYEELQTEKTVKNKTLSAENTVLYDKNGATFVLPWTYSSNIDSYGDNLPPSIKKLQLNDFININISEWGK